MLISSVIADARNFQIPAIAKISAPTLETRAVMAAVPTDTHALAYSPPGNTGTNLMNDTGYLVPWHARIFDARSRALFGEQVAMTDAAGMDLDKNVSRTGLGNLALNDLEIGPGFGNRRGSHWCICDSLSCHDAS